MKFIKNHAGWLVVVLLLATGAVTSIKTLELRKFNSDGDIKVALQDQTTPTLIVPANKVNATTALTAGGAKDDTTVTVASATSCIDGAFVTLVNVAANRYSVFHQVGAPAGLVLTLDTPLDYDYEIGDQLTCGTDNMAVDGSVTTQIFSLRAADPGIPITIDITRIIIECQTDSPVSLAKFGNLTALTNGLVLRRVDGFYNNIFNVKTNGELAGILYDYEPYLASVPAQSVDGFIARLTTAGASKLGVALRIGPGEDLQLLVRDNLAFGSPDITLLRVMFEGHVVDPS